MIYLVASTLILLSLLNDGYAEGRNDQKMFDFGPRFCSVPSKICLVIEPVAT